MQKDSKDSYGGKLRKRKRDQPPAKTVPGTLALERGTGRTIGDIADDAKRAIRKNAPRSVGDVVNPIKAYGRLAATARDTAFPDDVPTTKTNRRIGNKLRKKSRY
jgi:hypothetical protein